MTDCMFRKERRREEKALALLFFFLRGRRPLSLLLPTPLVLSILDCVLCVCMALASFVFLFVPHAFPWIHYSEQEKEEKGRPPNALCNTCFHPLLPSGFERPRQVFKKCFQGEEGRGMTEWEASLLLFSPTLRLLQKRRGSKEGF